jgi:hypothetical protein
MNGMLVLSNVLLLALVVFVLQQSVQAQPGGQTVTGGRYSVTESQGHNLIVTDNKTNTLYFYTVDKDKEVGSELKLRGTMDLNQVGQPTIKPVVAKKAG